MNKENKSQNKRKANWKIDIKDACGKRGITKPFALWQRIFEQSGGSKETAYDLWNGKHKMIQLETLNKLYDELKIEPHEIFINESENSNEPESEVEEIKETVKIEGGFSKTINEDISTEERFELCEFFIDVTESKILSEAKVVEFSQREKKAFREVVKIIEPMMKGWKNSGRPRDENPSEVAKYLRDYRARKKDKMANTNSVSSKEI